jgi:hypothetical protein
MSNLFSMAQPGIDYTLKNASSGYASDEGYDYDSNGNIIGGYDQASGDYNDLPVVDLNKFEKNQNSKNSTNNLSNAAQLFGKYGSLLGLPLQGLAVGQANRAIKDEIKRLQGEKPEVVDYGTVSLQGYKPSLMDPTQALLEADQVARTNAYNSAQIGAGNLGTAMANKQISDLTALRNKAKTRKEYDNLNREIENRAAEYAAQVGNQGTLYNKELQRAGMDATSQAAANYENQLFKLRQAMGQNRASGLQAGAQGLGATAQNVNYNQQLLGTLGQLFSNPETLKMLAKYGTKTT